MSIYLDNMAGTPIDPRVAEVHSSVSLQTMGNPQSRENADGEEAGRLVEEAARNARAPFDGRFDEAIFTPGAAPALWLAVEAAIITQRSRPLRVALSRAEHPALISALVRAREAGRLQIVDIEVDGHGAPDLASLERALDEGIDLVCTMAVNNEIGTISDLASIAGLASRSGARLLVDGSQAFGRIPNKTLALADLLVLSGAKIYGPRRSGVLLGSLDPGAHSLAHDVFGTPDVASAASLAHAMRLRTEEGAADEARIACMRDRLQDALVARVPGLRVNGGDHRIAGCLHVSTPHVPGEAVVGRVWGRISVSTGAACQSGAPGPSHVVNAMGLDEWACDGAVRIGIGRFNTDQEIDAAIDILGEALSGSIDTRKRA
ncbi:aminotransferase class V-fold PLP-dependent enzyme [Roseibium sp.]|uniref:cysteine desulfurase family protein n=1 Tax=Roseibium sp. TaxID=1936156 RepID=UPI0032967D33